MYFKSRKAAGQLLARQLVKNYRYEDCAVVALNDGAVVVGAQIAMYLHCVLTMLLTEPITLPQETAVLAEIDQSGDVTYDDRLTEGELQDITSEYFNYIEEQKLEKKFKMNRLLGAGGLISGDLLQGRNIIFVSDGLTNGMDLLAAVDFLKTVRTKKLIVATPFANVGAVDKMHILADEIYCLNVIEDIISVNHYYDTDGNDIPSHEIVIETIKRIILNWK